MSRPSITGALQAGKHVLRAFRRNWKLFLGIHIGVNFFSLLVLTPIFSLLMGWLILVSGYRALSDEDILLFALSPLGLMVIVLGTALYAIVVVFQQAAMIIAGYSASARQRTHLPKLLRYLAGKSWPLFGLAVQMILRTVLLVAPFIAVVFLIYQRYLTEFDINYYLQDRPAEFWLASGLMLLTLLAVAGILLRVFSGWVLALPLLLLDHERPAHALLKSRQASVAMRLPISLTLLSLFLVHTGLFSLASMLTDLGVDGVVILAGESLKVMAYLLGGLVALWLLSSLAIAFFSNSVLGLAILYMYSTLTRNPADSFPGELNQVVVEGHRGYLSPAKIVVFSLVVSIVAGFAISWMMNRLDLDTRTAIIAHRGASMDAPENTLAAIELAITQGADWVEIDVQETREGEVVVIHDRDLKKMGGVGLGVFDSTLAEIQSVDIGSRKGAMFQDQRIPTLQQALALCKDRIKVLIELKFYGREEKLEALVAEIVDAAGMQDQIRVMSLDYAGIQKMKSLRPDWQVGLLSSVALGDLTRLNADFFAVNARFANRAFIRRSHQRSRDVMVWTVNDPISMSAMMSKGVDGIITDVPALASSVRSERMQLETHERIMIQLASLLGKQPQRPEQ